MDLEVDLTAASHTLALIKQIKDLDLALDQAAFKDKLLDLQEAAFESRAALLEAKEAILIRDEQIADLKANLKAATSGESCPICQIGNLKITASKPHPDFGRFGHQERTLTCDHDDCSHNEKRRFDPNDKS